MLKILRIKEQYLLHVNIFLNQRIQCSSFSPIHKNSPEKNSKLESFLHNKSSKQCDFHGGIKANGLLRRRTLNFQHKSLRNFSELPPIVPPPIKYEGFMKIMVESPPVQFAQESLTWIHSATGLPWWATLVLVTVVARTCITLPCAVYTQYIIAKTNNLKWEMDDIVKELKHEANCKVTYGECSEPEARRWYNKAVRDEWNALIVRDNCHPAKGLILLLTQLPLWMILSAGTRNLCFMLPYPTPQAYHTLTELSTEGFGWITNLAAADPYYILPVTMGIINLCNVEFHPLMRPRSTFLGKVSLNIFRGFTLILVPIAAILPSGISLYWTASSAYGLAQNFLLISPKFRRACRIEWTEREIERPYAHLWNTLKERLPLRKNGKIETVVNAIPSKSAQKK